MLPKVANRLTPTPDRRTFLQTAALGLGGLTLPQLLRLRAESGLPASRERTAVILLFTLGGMSHIDTYDPKPDAPAEIRGDFKPIATKVPGLRISELLPLHAAMADKFSIVRSLAHECDAHGQGQHRLMTGHQAARESNDPEHPDFMAIAHHLRRRSGRDIPNYVGLVTDSRQASKPIPAAGTAYLGNLAAPLMVVNDEAKPNFKVGFEPGQEAPRLPERRNLWQNLNAFPQSRAADTMVAFQQQALDLFTGERAQRAFNLDLEPAALRDRYGRSGWGQQCLLARRLVEAGVDLVTVTLSGRETLSESPDWDDHAVNSNIFEALKARAPKFDRCVTALVSDLFERGLDRRVLVVVAGEFGRTPRISNEKSSRTGILQPGRNHWPQAMSVLFAGGGMRAGQVIGATNARGEFPTRRRFSVHDFLATIYRHLQIDAPAIQLPDATRRPIPILAHGSPISELLPST